MTIECLWNFILRLSFTVDRLKVNLSHSSHSHYYVVVSIIYFRSRNFNEWEWNEDCEPSGGSAVGKKNCSASISLINRIFLIRSTHSKEKKIMTKIILRFKNTREKIFKIKKKPSKIWCRKIIIYTCPQSGIKNLLSKIFFLSRFDAISLWWYLKRKKYINVWDYDSFYAH